jgi:pimeloyl-ACP methyl ester carboxylesterase
MNTRRAQAAAACAVALLTLLTACGRDPEPAASAAKATSSSTGTPATEAAGPPVVETMVPLPDGRRLYLRCAGTGSPTLVLEGGDDDTSASYGFAMGALAAKTRTCVYDRANLGRSDPDRRRRQLVDLVSDLEAVLDGGEVPGPYVLVGTSGGGYISVGYAVRHPKEVAGMVFVEVPPPFFDAPPEVVEATRWNSPENIESRDFLQVEKDAWAARRQIGDIPFTLLSNEYSESQIAAAEFPGEKKGMRANVRNQQGWFVLSPRAQQVVVHTGHAVEEADPGLVIDTILDVVAEARVDRPPDS